MDSVILHTTCEIQFSLPAGEFIRYSLNTSSKCINVLMRTPISSFFAVWVSEAKRDVAAT